MAEQYDVIIVGAGAAGLTAALYTARRALRTLVLSQDIGGQASTTAAVENYPGVELADGLALMMQFKQQAEKYGARIILDEVQTIRQEQPAGFIIDTAIASYRGRTVILAYGLTHRHLNIPGEKRFIGRGVTYCATCDAPLYRGRSVVVVGGGNSAMDAALLLDSLASRVSIVTINDEFHGERVMIDRLSRSKRITAYTQAQVLEILGQDRLTGVRINVDGRERTLDADGVFVEIGYTVNPQLVINLVGLDERRQIIVHPSDNSTNVAGIFAAGDVTNIRHKQIVISAGEGAKAALGVYQYLQTLGHVQRGAMVDWGVKTPMRHNHSPQKSKVRTKR